MQFYISIHSDKTSNIKIKNKQGFTNYYADNHIENWASAGSVTPMVWLKKCEAYFFKEAGAAHVFNVTATRPWGNTPIP